MNVTLSIDEKVLEKARAVASARGLSLNQMVRSYLEKLTAEGDVEADIREMYALSKKSRGRSRGWKFNRDEIHERT